MLFFPQVLGTIFFFLAAMLYKPPPETPQSSCESTDVGGGEARDLPIKDVPAEIIPNRHAKLWPQSTNTPSPQLKVCVYASVCMCVVYKVNTITVDCAPSCWLYIIPNMYLWYVPIYCHWPTSLRVTNPDMRTKSIYVTINDQRSKVKSEHIRYINRTYQKPT